MSPAEIRAQYPTLRTLADLVTTHTERQLERMGIDMADLPSYGGEQPVASEPVWSWDETHALVGTGDAIYIRERSAL